MKPGPRPRTTKFVPPEVIDEMVVKSSQYHFELFSSIDRLIAGEETDSNNKKSLKTMKDLLLKERANFRLMSKQISPDIDYVYSNVKSDVQKKTRDSLHSLAERLTPHFSDDLQGWSLHVGSPGGGILHFSYVDCKKGGGNEPRRFALTAVVTVFRHPAEPGKVFVNVVYLDDAGGERRQLTKDERMMFGVEEISVAIIPLLKSVEGKACFVLGGNDAGTADTTRATTDGSEKRGPKMKKDWATVNGGASNGEESVVKEEPADQPVEARVVVEEENANDVDTAEALPAEAFEGTPLKAARKTNRKRKSKFSQEFLREAMEDSDVEDEEEMNMRERIERNWGEVDEDFTPQDTVGTGSIEDDFEDVSVGDCRLCKEPLTLFSGVDHAKLCHAEMPRELFKCPVCGKQTTEMRYHLKRYHHPDRFECDLCHRPFTSEWILKKHRKIVHFPDDSDFLCDGPNGCRRRFFSEVERDRHLRNNHGQKKNKTCYICGVSYSANSRLQNHLATTHQVGEKAFLCPKCPKKFGSRKQLMAHFVVHDPNFNHACTICGKRFARKNNLNQHMVSHRPPKHQCEICGKKFLYRAAGLMTHMRQVHNVDHETSAQCR